MHRLRVRFSRGQAVKFISHLDIMRLWQRALDRAGIALAYSEGYNPRPRISLAAPLALGVTSEAELMDIFCTQMVSPHWFTTAAGQQLPPGIEILKTYSISPTLPSLQAQLRQAEYRVEAETDRGRQDTAAAISHLLEMEHLPWQHQRDTGPRHYDLRELIDDLWLVDWQSGHCVIGMRLRCGSQGSGRPEQVATVLGFPGYPISMHRARLILETS
ncbi:TIGR03936 family radical SAM-associated protein [Chloroflexota bacterium]